MLYLLLDITMLSGLGVCVPHDLLRVEVLSRLDEASRISLRIALCQQKVPKKIAHNVKVQAVKHGLAFTQFFQQRRLLSTANITVIAIQLDDLEILIHSGSRKYCKHKRLIDTAGFYGSIRCFKFLRDNWCSGYYHWSAYYQAARRGHLEILKLMSSFKMPVQGLMIAAISNNHPYCVAHILDLYFKETKSWDGQVIYDGMLGCSWVNLAIKHDRVAIMTKLLTFNQIADSAFRCYHALNIPRTTGMRHIIIMYLAGY